MYSLVFLDTETTGLDPSTADLLELSAVRVSDGKIGKKFDSLVKPYSAIPPIVQKLTGISDKDVEDALSLQEVRKNFMEKFLQSDDIIVAHNADFDLGFLNAKEFDLEKPYIDTYELAQIVFCDDDSLALDYLSSKYEIEHKNAHRALADVMATIGIWREMQKTVINNWSKALFDDVLKHLNKSSWTGKVFFEEIAGRFSAKTDSAQISLFDNDNVIIKTGTLSASNIDHRQLDHHELQITSKLLDKIRNNAKMIWEIQPPADHILCAFKTAEMVIDANLHQKIAIAFPDARFEDLKKCLNNPYVYKGVLMDKPDNIICGTKWQRLLDKQLYTNEEITLILKVLRVLHTGQIPHNLNLNFNRKEKVVFERDLTSIDHGLCDEHCFAKQVLQQSDKSQIVYLPLSALEYLEADHLIILEADTLDDNLTSLAQVKGDMSKMENFFANYSSKKYTEFTDALFFGFGLIAQFIREKVGQSTYGEYLKINPSIEHSQEFANFAEGFVNARNDFIKLFPNEKVLISEFDQWIDFFSRETADNELKMLYISNQDTVSCLRMPIRLDEVFSAIVDSFRSVSLLAEVYPHNIVQAGEIAKPLFAFDSEQFEYQIIASNFDYADQSLFIASSDFNNNDEKNAEKVASYLAFLANNTSLNIYGVLSSKNFAENVSTLLDAELVKNNQEVVVNLFGYGNPNKMINNIGIDSNRQNILLSTNKYALQRAFYQLNYGVYYLQKFAFDPPGQYLLEARKKYYKNEFFDFVLPRSIYQFLKVFYWVVGANRKFIFICGDPKILQTNNWGKHYFDALPDRLPKKFLDCRKLVDYIAVDHC